MKLIVKTKADLVAEEAARIATQAKREARDYLEATDWMIVRQAETGTPVPVEVLQQRADARLLLEG
jgi:hypothetical protein